MYGLPKIHKPGVPLRPILSMTGSPQYEVSKWLCKVLQPVYKRYNTHCVKDSFEFINLLRNDKLPSDGHMCSFNIVSLFTNVPLEETIQICAEALYQNVDLEPVICSLSERSFCKLLRMVTSGVEFPLTTLCTSRWMASRWVPRWDRSWQTSSLVGVSLRLRVRHGRTCTVVLWMILSHILKCRQYSDRLLEILNKLHPSLKFTCEHEKYRCLPYMDVFVEKTDDDDVLTSVYRKPTFTGLYIT